MKPSGQVLIRYDSYPQTPQKKDGMKSQDEDGHELGGDSCKATTPRVAGTYPRPEEARKDSLLEPSARTCSQTSSLQSREARHLYWF